MVRKKNNSKTPWEENKNNLEDQDNICFCCWIMLLLKKKKIALNYFLMCLDCFNVLM
jgi:hypothetical protein